MKMMTSGFGNLALKDGNVEESDARANEIRDAGAGSSGSNPINLMEFLKPLSLTDK